MKPFNLERALAGDPVMTQAGTPVTELTYFSTLEGLYPLRGVLGDTLGKWTLEGHYSPHEAGVQPNDLVMAPKICVKYLLLTPTAQGFDSIEELKAANPEFPLYEDSRRIVKIKWEE